jgi:glycosyltransferase involved in cell wall biosynthesis
VRRAVYLASERPWPTTSGGRAHAAMLATLLGERFELLVLSPDGGGSGPWAEARSRMVSRRAQTGVRLLDIARSTLGLRHAVLERAVRAGLPEAFGAALAAHEPSLVVLGRPFVGPFIDEARSVGARVVIDADESLARVARSIAVQPGRPGLRARAALESVTLDRMERREYPRADQVWVTSTVERGHFLRFLADEQVFVIPNVSPRAPAPSSPPIPITAVAFLGWYGYPPNEAAALDLMRDVMPRVRAMGGPRRLVLIGRDPTARMREMAAADTDTEITGEVEEIARPLQAAGLLVCPLRFGGGTRIKILEAMALGVPVVSTSMGIEGLDLRGGSEVIVADTPEALAASIAELARDPESAARLAAAGAQAVAERWSPAAAAAALDGALGNLADIQASRTREGSG